MVKKILGMPLWRSSDCFFFEFRPRTPISGRQLYLEKNKFLTEILNAKMTSKLKFSNFQTEIFARSEIYGQNFSGQNVPQQYI